MTPTSASSPGVGSSKVGSTTYSIEGSSFNNNKYVGGSTADVDDSYFPPFSPSTPKPSSPANPSPPPPPGAPDWEGFVLNGDVDDDFDTLRRASFRSSASHAPLPSQPNAHPRTQPQINKTPSWAKCAPPPKSSGILFKRTWTPQSHAQNQVVVQASQNGGSTAWSG